ncbi:MAG: sodium:alanine symporter family protein [Gemmatimonadales bacterium]|nr:MAG: sodium:alanine symporter family protein [Gemmatimonadales bacterium]
MDAIQSFVGKIEDIVWTWGIPVGDESIPAVVILLLGAGVYFTLRLGFIQFRRLGHGFAVVSGKYDDPDDTGDVTHFQALSTALSATVGIGNIAGVALAIHWGGPGALFWMWVTGVLGMATKFSEVTLSQKYRNVREPDPERPWEGMIAGGPMYYIERGLGKAWKPMAIIFAVFLAAVALFTGNGVQANTVADVFNSEFGFEPWMVGLVTATIIGLVIIGGIGRIGRVTGILAPAMAGIYVAGALVILMLNWDQVLPSFALIFTEAFSPSAGVAGAGVGTFLFTMLWGVRRGLFSNEAGQGSSPIAHAAAKTEEPAEEGMVGLLGPFIDTIVICTMTALVIIITGTWDDKIPQQMNLSGGAITYVTEQESGRFSFFQSAPEEIRVEDGVPVDQDVGVSRMAWHEVAIDEFFIDAEQTQGFTGVIIPGQNLAVADDGTEYRVLHGNVVQNGAPLTMLSFQRGLPGDWGHYIVILTVLLFGISTAIAWSYYGDRCAFYLFGPKAVLPYKLIFVAMHFVGAVTPLILAWTIGDILLGLVIIPNLIAVVVLAPKVQEAAESYFERKPWLNKKGGGAGRDA